METKDWITLTGLGATFLVALTNLFYTFWSNRKAAFVNTVTSSRIKWIESLRDKVSAFIAVNELLVTPVPKGQDRSVAELIRDRDTLRHQIILHLNPNDEVDQQLKALCGPGTGSY